jgi:7-cyano-7-deazaguanine synthase
MNGMKPAVVLLSGGLDSATTLAIAKAEGYACHCLSVDYGQRHVAELSAAARVAEALGAAAHRVLHLDMNQFGGSALTDTSIAVPTDGVAPGIPVTYVPARNTIMLSLALAWAEVLGARDIFVGVNALTVSCYQADAVGQACGTCDSCRLRRAGFESAGLPDPTRYH